MEIKNIKIKDLKFAEYNPRKLLFARKPNRTPTVPPENFETGYITDHKGYVYVPSFNKEPECIGKENFYPATTDFREYFESRLDVCAELSQQQHREFKEDYHASRSSEMTVRDYLKKMKK